MNIILFVPEYRQSGSANQLVVEIEDFASKMNADFDIVYVKKEVNPLQQQQFLYAVHIADIVIIDCTIPRGYHDGGVYPALTAQINCLNHIIVVSETNLPLNITPYRGAYPTKDNENYCVAQIMEALPDLIKQSLDEDKYPRLPMDMYKDFEGYQGQMEDMIYSSLDYRKKSKSSKIPVMISYRNSHSDEVEDFKKIVEGEDEISKNKRKKIGIPGDYELKVLPPASLCGAYEAHTPMRRWMLVGLLENHIREVDEVWVYESRDKEGNIDYTNSWWTIAEMIMVANLNFSNEKQIKVRVYNPIENKFHDVTEENYTQYSVTLSAEQYKRFARLLANSRPDTMGPEQLAPIMQMKVIANMMRLCPPDMKQQMLEEIRKNIELVIPKDLQPEERDEMADNLMELYSNPEEMERYANDDVFKNDFWGKISYQTKAKTDCFVDGIIDVDRFISIPMAEITGKTIDDFEKASESKEQAINLGTMLRPHNYKVTKASFNRYLWLATRMGKPTIKGGNAPGLERIPIYNIEKM